MNPKRILQVTSILNIGGIESLLMNIFRNIDREKFVFDFLVVNEAEGFFEKEILSLGGRIYKIPSLKKSGYFRFKKNLEAFFDSHKEYTIVHSHIDTFSGIVLNAAKKFGVRTRIAHAHSAFPKYSLPEILIKGFFKRSVLKSATDLFACSHEAAVWLFKRRFSEAYVLKSGIDTKSFIFSEDKRNEFRARYKIEGKFVLINVGRFAKSKNHTFLISIFEKVTKIKEESILILVGDGNQKKKIERLVEQKSLCDKVLFFDTSTDVTPYLNAADVYVSTSEYEGFGISVAEAQFNSLSCVISKGFPKEINLFGRCRFLSLKDSSQVWANSISDISREKIIPQEMLYSSEHDIKNTVNFLSKFYDSK